MGITIIIKDGKPRGRTRSRVDREIQDMWGTTSFRSEEDADKARFLERKIKKKHGADDSMVKAKLISDV